MSKKNFFLVLCGVLINVFCISSNGYADRRGYVWTYEYMTMPKGMWEVEQYLTSQIPNINKSYVNTLKYWLELEYGISDRWDVAMYQLWKFDNKDKEKDYEYEGFKLRSRYRFFEKGEFIIDPLIYAEYIRDDNFHKPDVGEVKLILAKDIGALNISYNQIAKRNLEREGKTENEYACGLSSELSPVLRLGLESKGNYSKDKYAIGPTISFAKGKYWAALGTAFGLSQRTNDIEARLIFGILF